MEETGRTLSHSLLGDSNFLGGKQRRGREWRMPNPITKLHYLCFSRRRLLPSLPPSNPSSSPSDDHDDDSSNSQQHVPPPNSPSSSSCTSSPELIRKPINSSSLSFSSSTSTSAVSELSTAIASRRLFPASPGCSNAIADASAVAFGIGLAIPTYSPEPQAEFHRSMQEMATAMGLADPVAHRDRLYELLLCYLTLNRKNAHNYIVAAFADLLSSLESESRG